MGFASGSVSFRRFAVLGSQPDRPDEGMLEKLGGHALNPGELGIPEEVEYGWCGGRHILDTNFSFEHNVFNDALSFGLRIDTNKVPGDLKKAYQLMEEEATAATNPSGFISKNQKKDVKETVRKKVEEDLRSGRFRKSKLLPILWDLPGQMLYCPAGGSTQEQLLELFERTFELKLLPLSAGGIALRHLEANGRRRDYEDFRPTRFVLGPEGESQFPEYPWIAKGPEPKDFLGNEFLVWIWHEADARTSIVGTDAGDITLMLDKSLDLECAYGQSGKDSLKGDAVSRMPEARDGLRSGKVPRKSTLIIDANRQGFTFTLSAEPLSFASLVLPEVEEADSPRTLYEERITLLRDFCKSMDALYDVFLKVRGSSAWEGQTAAIRKWILQPARPLAAVA
jgi:hypothetical protein